MTGHDPRFDRWDAAYVLGALSADDRRDYEEHLSECPRCRAEVAELNGLPGLLSRIPGDRALGLIAGPPDGVPSEAPRAPAVREALEAVVEPEPVSTSDLRPPTDLAERLHRRHRLQRRHRVLTVAGAVLAAAVVAVAAVLGIQTVFGVRQVAGPTTQAPTARTPTLVAQLGPVVGGPSPDELSASVRLYAKAWGTEVDTECRHQVPTTTPSTGESDESYGLFLVDAQGQKTLVSSWRGIPRSPIDTTAATAVRIGQMKHLELVSLPDRTVLLRGDVPG